MSAATPDAVPAQFAVDDKAIAVALGCSVDMVRKDRRGKKQIPHFRIGTLVRYDLQTVREAMLKRQEGGPAAGRK